MRETLAGRTRKAAQGLGEFRVRDLADEMGILTSGGRIRVRTRLQDFLKRGEMVRVARGIYQYIPQKKVRTKMDIIWHLVRSHRQFTTDEIERLSGAARATAGEYLSCLKKLGFLRKVGRQSWRLVNDPGPETPVNVAKCERLRKGRRQRTEDGGRRSEDGGQMTDDGGQRTEVRGRRSEDRGRRTEDGGQGQGG